MWSFEKSALAKKVCVLLVQLGLRGWHCPLVCSAVTMTMPTMPGQRHMVTTVTFHFFWLMPENQVYLPAGADRWKAGVVCVCVCLASVFRQINQILEPTGVRIKPGTNRAACCVFTHSQRLISRGTDPSFGKLSTFVAPTNIWPSSGRWLLREPTTVCSSCSVSASAPHLQWCKHDWNVSVRV